VFIGPCATFTNDPYPMSPKMIGVVVEDGAIIGGRAVFKPGVRVGRNSVVGMASVVTKDVPPETVVMGHPATVRYSREDYNIKKNKWNIG
jgi:UDP-2-acetamido-3-amino-2,3-dideoxy-glucuronate N-acetyltransferase